jgi:hypothetical protein
MSEVYTALRSETPQEQVDRAMRDLRVVAERREEALRLLNNRDFQSLIMRFYCVDEAARLAQMGGMLGVSKVDQDSAIEMAKATGHLKRFMDVTVKQGEQAIAQLSNYNQEYSELIQGEGAE